jgi:IS5 family transposase
MRGQAGFFDVDERLKELSAKGDHLERLNAIIDFELFRPDLARAVPRSEGARGGRPAFDHVFMFKVLVLQASHSLSDERTEFLVKDRLSFMRFLGLGLADPVPDANTIWTFREALTRAQIEGKTDAARYDGALLPELVHKTNTASDVWADTAYRSNANERHLANNGLRSRIHRKKPKGKPMPAHIARANGRKSKVRAAVEHVFAHQKGPMGLVVRTIGLARARVKIGLANLVFNMKRMVWLSVQAA